MNSGGAAGTVGAWTLKRGIYYLFVVPYICIHKTLNSANIKLTGGSRVKNLAH